MKRLCFALLPLLLAGADARADFDPSPITAGVSRIVSPGAPGPVYALGNAWTAVASTDDDGSLPGTFCMVRPYGSGKVMVLGHDGILGTPDVLDDAAFLGNAFHWLAGADSQRVAFTTGHAEWFQGSPALRQIIEG